MNLGKSTELVHQVGLATYSYPVLTSFLGDSIIVLETTEIEHLLRSYQSLFCIVLDMAIEFLVEPLGNPWTFTHVLKEIVSQRISSSQVVGTFPVQEQHDTL